MTNFGVNKLMTTVEPSLVSSCVSLVSSGVKMVVVGIRVKGRQGGERVYSDTPPESVLPAVFRSKCDAKLRQKTCAAQQHSHQL